MPKLIVPSGIVLALSVAPVLAQDAAAPTLWGGARYDEAPAAVAVALAALPEVKSAKVKGSGVSIAYKGAGIAILRETFTVLPIFEAGKLKRIELVTAATCANDVGDRYQRLFDILHDKYPQDLVPGLDQSATAVLRARSSVMPGLPTTSGAILGNEQVFVFAQVLFNRLTPPPHASRAMRQVSNLLWAEYAQRSQECGGTGATRAQIRLIYGAASDFARMRGGLEREHHQESVAAGGKL